MLIQHGRFDIADDLLRVDFAAVHRWLTGSYWSPGIARDRVEHAARHSSLVVSSWDRASGAQAGYLRVISDQVRLAYLCDVFVSENFRHQGLARAMVSFAMNHPDHRNIAMWLLATQDAHDVYRGVGFEPLAQPERWMIQRPGQRRL